MMLMRDRSGRSGRRRGSQNPGTAIGSADGVGRLRGRGAGSCGGDCRLRAAAASIAASRAATAKMPPPRAH